jgi:hypothetical protein
VIAANFFGQRLILMWEGLLGRIPVVKSIYSSVKQVSDTVLSDQGTAFRKALLVEFPAPGLLDDRVSDRRAGRCGRRSSSRRPRQRLRADHAQPDRRLLRDGSEERVRELDMSVDDALKYIISMGVVSPRRAPRPRDGRTAAAVRPPTPKLTRQVDRRARRAVARAAAIACPDPDTHAQPPENALKRTDYCGRIDRRYLDQTVTLMGWVHRRRDQAAVIFVDLRDREGLVQIVFNPDRVATFKLAESLRSEYVIASRARAPAAGGRRQSEPRVGEIEVLAQRWRS